MGSTSGSERLDVQTISPVRNLVRLGRFSEAQQSLSSFRTSSVSLEASLLYAICKYRLGDEAALGQFYRDYKAKLSQEQLQMAFRHEVLGHICAQPQRLDAALKLLPETATPEGHRDLQKLWSALRVLREGQNAATPKRHPHYRVGAMAPAASRADYLIKASEICQAVADKHVPADGEPPSLIRIISNYMLLRIELRMSPHIRNNLTIKHLHQELGAIDKGVKASLPSPLVFRFVQYQRDF